MGIIEKLNGQPVHAAAITGWMVAFFFAGVLTGDTLASAQLNERMQQHEMSGQHQEQGRLNVGFQFAIDQNTATGEVLLMEMDEIQGAVTREFSNLGEAVARIEEVLRQRRQ